MVPDIKSHRPERTICVSCQLHAPASDEDLIEVPLVLAPWPAAAQAAGKRPAELLAPAPHGLIGDDDAPLGQKQLDVPQAEAEHVI